MLPKCTEFCPTLLSSLDTGTEKVDDCADLRLEMHCVSVVYLYSVKVRARTVGSLKNIKNQSPIYSFLWGGEREGVRTVEVVGQGGGWVESGAEREGKRILTRIHAQPRAQLGAQGGA